jgi:hypothetical protein
MLNQVSAARHVQHLRAAADRKHRHVASERGLQQRKLCPIARFDHA